MFPLLVTTRISRMTFYVFVFAVFGIGSGLRNVQASCGDYLEHSRLSSKDSLTHDSLPVTSCKGGNCRSAPSLPPVEPPHTVFPHRQPFDFEPTDKSSDSLKSRMLDFFDDALPSSAMLEVTTPPPILNA